MNDVTRSMIRLEWLLTVAAEKCSSACTHTNDVRCRDSCRLQASVKYIFALK